MDQANQEYIDAFNADDAPMVADGGDMPPEADKIDEAEAEAMKAELMRDDTENIVGDDDIAGEGEGDNASAAVSLTEGGDDLDGDDEELTPEEEQRKRSWEGRLRKMEEELKAREAALAGGEEPAAEDMGDELGEADDVMADGAGEEPAGSMLDDIKREAAELAGNPERLQATIQQMVDDFGREFVVAAAALAGPVVDAKAESYINDVNSSMSSLIDDVTDAFRSMHRATIADAHEDFEDIVQGEDFQGFLDNLDPEARQRADQTIESGSAGQIIKLLNQFKDSLKQGAEDASFEDAWAEDAASGVKSSAPVRLPSRAPVSEQDEYVRAWQEA